MLAASRIYSFLLEVDRKRNLYAKFGPDWKKLFKRNCVQLGMLTVVILMYICLPVSNRSVQQNSISAPSVENKKHRDRRVTHLEREKISNNRKAAKKYKRTSPKGNVIEAKKYQENQYRNEKSYVSYLLKKITLQISTESQHHRIKLIIRKIIK